MPAQHIIRLLQNPNTPTANSLTVDRALELLRATESQKELGQSGIRALPSGEGGPTAALPTAQEQEVILAQERAQELFERHNLADMPEVGARETDYDNMPRSKHSDEQRGPRTVSEHRERHDNRRSKAEGLINEEDID
jgi:hypothetical protein